MLGSVRAVAFARWNCCCCGQRAVVAAVAALAFARELRPKGASRSRWTNLHSTSGSSSWALLVVASAMVSRCVVTVDPVCGVLRGLVRDGRSWICVSVVVAVVAMVSCCVAGATDGSVCGVLRGHVRDGRSWICVSVEVAAEAVAGEEARACGGAAVLASASGEYALAVPRGHCCWRRIRCPCR